MIEEVIKYGEFRGFLVWDPELPGPRPGVLLCHAWRGLDPFIKQKARLLAALGYTAFAADMYGKGHCAKSDEEAFGLMAPLFTDRNELQKRVTAGFQCLRDHSLVG